MRTRSRRRGFTIVEVIVHSAILVSFMTSVYGILIAGMRIMTASNDRFQVQQSVESSLYRMAREVKESDAASVSVFPNATASTAPAGITFESARTSTGLFVWDPTSGLPQWQSYVVYYLNPDPVTPGVSDLLRTVVTPSNINPQAPTTLSMTTADVQEAAGGVSVVIARGVQNLQVTMNQGVVGVVASSLQGQETGTDSVQICLRN